MKPGSGGLWNSLALHEKKAIVDQAKPVELATLGQDLAESNESKATQAEAIAKATMTDADKRIVVGKDGVITVPAAACCKPQGNTATIVFMKSFSGGMQLHYNRMGNPEDFEYTVDVPQAGKYGARARVVTVSSDQHLLVAANNVKEPHDIALPYTVGMWEKTPPVEIALAKGQNVLRFSRHDPRRGLTIKDFTLTPVK